MLNLVIGYSSEQDTHIYEFHAIHTLKKKGCYINYSCNLYEKYQLKSIHMKRVNP